MKELNKGILYGLLIVAMVGVLRAENSGTFVKAISSELLTENSLILRMSWITVFTGVIIWYFFYALIIHLIARVFERTASFKQFLNSLGLAYYPQIIAGIIILFVWSSHLEGLEIVVSENFSVKQFLLNQGIYWTRIIDFLGLIFTYLICSFIVRKLYGFKIIQAIIICGAPVLLYEGAKFLILN